jgi:hypothetical protein
VDAGGTEQDAYDEGGPGGLSKPKVHLTCEENWHPIPLVRTEANTRIILNNKPAERGRDQFDDDGHKKSGDFGYSISLLF